MTEDNNRYKCFTLIHGDSLHFAPQKKVIPSDQVSKMLDAEQLLETVKVDANRYIQEITEKCEKLKEEASVEGFTEGFRSWAEQIAYVEEQLELARKELEKVLVPAVMKAAKKIVGREIDISEDTLADIVAVSLKSVSQHKKIIIWVNKKSLEVLERHRPKLKTIFEHLEVLKIQERDDLSDGSCVIETEGGIINARIEHQWEILEGAFKKLMSSMLKKGKSQEESQREENYAKHH